MRFTPGYMRSARRGVTLLEIMMVMTLAAAMLSVVVPSVLTFRKTSSLNTTAYEFARDLGRARIEAVKRNQMLIFTRLADTAYQVGDEPVRRLSPAVTFKEDESAESLKFSSMGVVADGTSQFKLVAGSSVRTVTVRASGHASVK